jgi:HD superfamily phosphohydrolase
MAQKLTLDDILNLSEVIEIDDVRILPRPRFADSEVRDLIAKINPKKILGIYDLMNDYSVTRAQTGSEPDWISLYPENVRGQLRYDYAIQHENPLAILNIFSHTGLTYMIVEGGLCEDVASMFGLWRLQGIRQLGFLQAPWMASVKVNMPIAEHNRLVHSMDVMVVATMIGYNNDLSPSQLNTLRVAAMTHDMGTPAGGDSVKFIDLPALDEDANYQRLLRLFPERQRLWDKYGIDEKVLMETIYNEGLLGQILDVADKLAYTARDLWACESFIQYGARHMNQGGLQVILDLLAEDQNPCSLWDNVSIHGEKIGFTDVGRLERFLKIRALMFRELYLHPHARFGEWLVARVLVKTLYAQGVLTRDRLLEMNDSQLEAFLNQMYRGRRSFEESLIEDVSDVAQCRSFRTLDEAEAFKSELTRMGNPFALIEDNSRPIKTGVHLNIATQKGLLPLKEAYPERAKIINDMAHIEPAVHVYYLMEEPRISREELASIAQSQ